MAHHGLYQPLLDSSVRFLRLKRVYRYHLKKVADMNDEEIIRACHHYVEDNNLTEEWMQFRKVNEGN